MCGFVGFRTQKDPKRWREELGSATSSLGHRGPDDSGLFFDLEKGVGLGHRRLSIIDLSSTARQPMASDDGGILIVYNGELYNFPEIKKSLEKEGYQFKSRSDTEVVLKAYVAWGINAVERFVGMFALAIWDSRHDRFFLVRDRLGIKPLYYYFRDGDLLFASELKALMAFKGFEKGLEPGAIPLFLHYQYLPAPQTIFKDTFKLLPGHWAVIEGGQLKVQSYWKLPAKRSHFDGGEFSENEAHRALKDILTRSVEDRLVSDVPLGALLSGGVDSSLMVALMQEVSSTPVRTFSIGFHVPGYDEAPRAAEIARHLGTDHTELYATPAEALEIIPRLPEIFDEPFADSSAIPTVLVSRLARSEVTVALSGDGGDEQFAGYARYSGTRFMVNASRVFPLFFRRYVSAVLRNIPADRVEKIYQSCGNLLPGRLRVENFRDKWHKFVALFLHAGDIIQAYRAAVCIWSREELQSLAEEGFPESRFEEIFRETRELPFMDQLMKVDMGTYLPDDLLTKVDRASMSVGLEVRVPLLDHRVVEYSSQLPETLKYRKGTGKYLLKRILAQFVPRKLFERPKMGFGVPIHSWLREDLRPLLLDYLASERLKREGVFDSLFVEQKIREHLSGKADHRHHLWSLLMWEMWRERWL